MTARRWQRVGYHVAGCPRCRQEADELRRVATTLSGSAGRGASAPGSLESRLQDIAGAHMHAPLYLSSRAAESLPSRRRILRARAAQGGAVLAATLVSVFVLALLLSPEPQLVQWTQLRAPALRPALASGVTGPVPATATPSFANAVKSVVSSTASNVANGSTGSTAGGSICRTLHHCRERLAGLPLATLATEGEGPDAAARMVFTDGERLLYVCWYPGVLEDEGDVEGQAQDRSGTRAAWQSGAGVWFVEAGDDPELLRAAVAGLPEAAPWELSLLDRLQGGFERLLGVN